MNKPEHPPSRKGGGYPKEFREEAVRYWVSSGRKASEIAPELGVSDWSLNRWRKEMENVTVSSAPERHRFLGSRQRTECAGVSQREWFRPGGTRRRENEALSRQREVLPSAISIFSADNPPGGLR